MKLSLIVTAPDIKKWLLNGEKRNNVVRWCGEHQIEKVYLEVYRAGYAPPDEALIESAKQFRAAGIEVHGCICPSKVGAASNGWPDVSCFSKGDAETLLPDLFRRAVTLFDTVIIDNRLFTDCACDACSRAKGALTFREFHRRTLTRVFEHCVIEPCRKINPDAHLILKFPSWYEGIASRGYDVEKHSALFPEVAAGAETRDPASDKWGRRQPYGSYFTVAWYRAIAGDRCRKAWVDPIACTPEFFFAQAVGSILAGADEIILFCLGQYYSKQPSQSDYPHPIKALQFLLKRRGEIERIEQLLTRASLKGIAAYKNPEGDARGEPYVFEYLGMRGLPFVPCAVFPGDASSAAFCEASLGDTHFKEKMEQYLQKAESAHLSSRLVRTLGLDVARHTNVTVYPTHELTFPDRIPRMPDEKSYHTTESESAQSILSSEQCGRFILSSGEQLIIEYPSAHITIAVAEGDG